ncbi:MAG: hypothetical protein NC548_50365, partial [Lachnospiraceae bacterium]|nr:hypothetical protein [Lachnospiraceae bacterium]
FRHLPAFRPEFSPGSFCPDLIAMISRDLTHTPFKSRRNELLRQQIATASIGKPYYRPASL